MDEMMHFDTMDVAIKQILQAAVQAPSGDNAQPWRFVIRERVIELYNIPERDTSLFNFKNRASFIAHGAVIENIVVAASVLGHKAIIDLFPSDENKNHVANIQLEQTTPQEDSLYRAIFRRATNRKPYLKTPLAMEERMALLNTQQVVGYGEIRLFENEREKGLLAEAVSLNERLVFENSLLHRFFFDHIRWNEKEAREQGDGFYIKTLELPTPLRMLFRLLRYSSVVRLLNCAGFSKSIPKQLCTMYRSSPALGVVLLNAKEPKDFVLGGRVMEHLWLEATRLGLSLQPLTGLTFLIHRVEEYKTDGLTEKQIKLIETSNEKIREAVDITHKYLGFIFRVGRGEPPSARTTRLPLERVLSVV